jgi:hypothetical protein
VRVPDGVKGEVAITIRAGKSARDVAERTLKIPVR